MREENDEIVKIAKKACKVCCVDIIYDEEKEGYIVFEINGILAFATPEQEKLGLNFNDGKIDLIVEMRAFKDKSK